MFLKFETNNSYHDVAVISDIKLREHFFVLESILFMILYVVYSLSVVDMKKIVSVLNLKIKSKK